MTLTPDITYRNMPGSDWLDAEIQKRAARLSTFCTDILSCKVLVEIPHRHHGRGNRFYVRIDMAVPGEKIVSGHVPSLHATQRDEHEVNGKRIEVEAPRKDALLVLRQTFAAAKRQLQDYVRRRRPVKTRENVRRVPAPA